MIDLTQYGDRLSEGAQEAVSLAIEESQRRQHFELGIPHLIFAVIRVDGWLLEELARELDLSSRELLGAVRTTLDDAEATGLEQMQVPFATRQAMQAAWDRAQVNSRSTIQTSDLFAALLESPAGQNLLGGIEVSPKEAREALSSLIQRRDQREREIKKKYELPPYLKQFSVNLNKLAALDRLPSLIGREAELNQMIEILSHRERSNSVILTGEAGVGKTALAEGLAQLIEFHPEMLPVRLRNRQIVNLQMNSLVAGTMFRGMFEDRIEKILKELRSRPYYILFIDEIHTMIGAGSAMGVPADAANIFKSSLARGEIQIVGATTTTEYKQFIAEDEALARRFRVIPLEEPSPDEALEILRGTRPRIERQYGVTIPDATLTSAVELSKRYNRHLRLPDKAIGWLHTASVRTELSQPGTDVSSDQLMHVIADDARIPADMVFRDTNERFRDIEAQLRARVVGQEEAIRRTAMRLRLNKGPLKENFHKPDAVLLYLGPTGVGKTELGRSIADFLFGDENKMIRVDMSEYQDGNVGVEKLIGMPRGIVGSEQGGILTNSVREHPCSVVLLDEVEKAHPLLLNLFLQVFDEGWLTDGRGKRVYFSDTVIIMTSNLGSEEFAKAVNPLGFAAENSSFDNVRSSVVKVAEERFSPEFLNRVDELIIFNPLHAEQVRQITQRYLRQLEEQMQELGKSLVIEEAAVDHLAEVGFSPKYGARFLKRKIDAEVKIPITMQWDEADEFLVAVDDGRLVVGPNIPDMSPVFA